MQASQPPPSIACPSHHERNCAARRSTASTRHAQSVGTSSIRVCSARRSSLAWAAAAQNLTLGLGDIAVDIRRVGTAPFAEPGFHLRMADACLGSRHLARPARGPWAALRSNKKVKAGPSSAPAEDVLFLARLAESEELKPVIDRRYALDKIAQAHRHVNTGHKRGSVVVTVA